MNVLPLLPLLASRRSEQVAEREWLFFEPDSLPSVLPTSRVAAGCRGLLFERVVPANTQTQQAAAATGQFAKNVLRELERDCCNVRAAAAIDAASPSHRCRACRAWRQRCRDICVSTPPGRSGLLSTNRSACYKNSVSCGSHAEGCIRIGTIGFRHSESDTTTAKRVTSLGQCGGSAASLYSLLNQDNRVMPVSCTKQPRSHIL